MNSLENQPLVRFDFSRYERLGIAEAILAKGKTLEQIEIAIDQANHHAGKTLVTRLESDKFFSLPKRQRADLDLSLIHISEPTRPY